MGEPVGTPRGGLHRDGAVAALLRLSFRARYGAVVRRFSRLHRAVTLASVFSLLAMQPVAAAGNLTLPFNVPQPRITSWTDHHYPDRQDDGTMIRFDGARGYAYDGHRGTDFAVPSNTPVLAADEGTVIYSEWSDSGGWGVVIDHAYDRTAYFHNNQLFVYPGQHVSRGQLIALSGSTGNSTGPHLHFEVRDLLTPWHSVDPYGWTGPGKDPWRWDLGNLWTSNPPVPFLLPLAFPGGAHWNSWYGMDGPPPPVSWRLRDGGHGLAGFAARWDQDPGAAAGRTLATSGSAAAPGPRATRRGDGLAPGARRHAGHGCGSRGAGRTPGSAGWHAGNDGRAPGTSIGGRRAPARHRCLAAWIGRRRRDIERAAGVGGGRRRRCGSAFRPAPAAGRWDHLEQLRDGRTAIRAQGARADAGLRRWQHRRR